MVLLLLALVAILPLVAAKLFGRTREPPERGRPWRGARAPHVDRTRPRPEPPCPRPRPRWPWRGAPALTARAITARCSPSSSPACSCCSSPGGSRDPARARGALVLAGLLFDGATHRHGRGRGSVARAPRRLSALARARCAGAALATVLLFWAPDGSVAVARGLRLAGAARVPPRLHHRRDPLHGAVLGADRR